MPSTNPIDAAKREAKRLSKTSGISHQQALDQVARDAGHARWSDMLNAPAAPAGAPIAPAAPRPRDVAMTPRMMADLLDPDNGPYDDAPSITVRCPVHDDRTPSLVISGTGPILIMKCLSGCDARAVSAAGVAARADAFEKTLAFMEANAESPVVEGFAIGRGGRGGRYKLANGKSHSLTRTMCEMLPEGGPTWRFG